MTGQPGTQHGRDEEGTSSEPLNEDGAGLGMSEEGTTFEPEETPEAVEDPADDGDPQDDRDGGTAH